MPGGLRPCGATHMATHFESSIPEPIEETTENDLLDPVENDVSVVEEIPVELTYDQKYDKLGMAVTKHSLNRDPMYQALRYCFEEKPLREVEDYIASLPSFARSTMNQYYMLQVLVRAYGMEMIERDIDGNQVTPEQKEGLSEDEIDDLVYAFSFQTTDIGRDFVEQNSAHSRLAALINYKPERKDTYIELLEFIAEQPRSYDEVKELLAGRPILEVVIDGTHETMQPSVFVDKLDRAGAIAWDKGWNLTEEGREFLEELKTCE